MSVCENQKISLANGSLLLKGLSLDVMRADMDRGRLIRAAAKVRLQQRFVGDRFAWARPGRRAADRPSAIGPAAPEPSRSK